MSSASTSRIEATPGVCGGRPRIAGHRIRVQDIVIWHEVQGLSPDDIVSGHPSITLADVHAALCYYHEHRAAIDRDIRAEREFVERFRIEMTGPGQAGGAGVNAAAVSPGRKRGRGGRPRPSKARR
ncbi:MAG TPA: DUF433 domain-containing protein [Phycisphaerae bacterium]